MSPTVRTFGAFQLDAGRGHLYRDGQVVPLTPKALSLLDHLVTHAGRLVTKSELMTALWGDAFVGDAVLKSCIREVRRALDDTPDTPRFIETAHRRGYRFIAPVAALEGPPALGASSPRVSYARSGHVNIAYQVVGDGPVDLVFVMGWVSHLECFWSEPGFARFLTRLSGMARLILFDKRGTGLSDRVSESELPTLEQRMDDVRAVMEAAGSQRAVLMGVSEGGPMCALFAATHPGRTAGLIMIGSYARRMRDSGYPWGVLPAERDRFCQTILDEWGGPVGIEDRAPSRLNDSAFRDWWASYLRMGASPGAAVALTRMNAAIDVRDVLPSIRVPALVLHRTGDHCLRIEEGRYLAGRIPGARFIELAGDDHLPFVGDQEPMLEAIRIFIEDLRALDEADVVLASALAVRGTAEALSNAALGRAFEQAVARGRGRRVDVDGDAWVAVFDGPGRAVQCGTEVIAAARRSGVALTAGVHIGECTPGATRGPLFDTTLRL
ncbi:MAG: alpha/beta fold hydrolase, partial [Acidobacteria bacterium]|nr:alpha/beta fold hydrolase [Acidobacteriota bacterium]